MQNSTPVLIVDDDPDITQLLCQYLEGFQFNAHIAHDGASMRAQLRRHTIRLVLLDVMLPGESGLSLAREIRQRSQLPVIMLSARAQVLDRVIGLENGADDYISKPFEPRELVARMQTVLRRATGTEHANQPELSDVVCFDGWELHRQERSLHSPTGMVVPLSNAEFRLLNTFLQSPRKLLTRDWLMEQARGRNMDAFERSIDLLISRLRQKLISVREADPPIIKTVRGAGYMLNVHSVEGRMAWRM